VPEVKVGKVAVLLIWTH